jgi:flavin-dependent dehydrogenase
VPENLDADVIIIGGGPAGSALGTYLARDGHRAIILEKDIHPREHIGESLLPSTSFIFEELGVLDRLDEAGFVHKPGGAWNGPRTPPWNFVEVWLYEFPIPGIPRPYTYNVEREDLDAILLRNAHQKGAKVLQGVAAQQVLFEEGRAVGVRANVADGWSRDLRARAVVDASGRRCVLARQLRMIRKDPSFDQFAVSSWFQGVKQPPERLSGFTLFYFLGLPKGWAWQIPLRNGVTSVGVVVEKRDFQKAGRSEEEFFYSLVRRSRNFTEAMQNAQPIRDWQVHGDYSYKTDTFAGPGWLLVGDALRFIDPVFSSGVDVALYSAKFAYEAMKEAWETGDEARAFERYQERVGPGVDVFYEMIDTFYLYQNLFTLFTMRRRWREMMVKAHQGNPYLPETQRRTRKLLDAMHEAHERIMADSNNLLHPWALDRILERSRSA